VFLNPPLQPDLVNRTFLLGTIRTLSFGADTTKVDVAKSGDLGYTQGPFFMTTSDPKTRAPVTEKGKYLTVFRKQADGAWGAVEDTFMSDAPRRGEAVK
jgi:ketosteroid isomerase-like protein